ncbi:monoacylglycerol lipase ABHD6-like [Varanus komodoensis]|uniref:monoacylglycerol lipase ABHD6-like n=1 Tax=Varanus komodoensis TaxID=61221 RepID=UPI001CF7AB2C|nr:monoacylglycerol lipase ABHD6-like [Varanus komodoensis]
MDLTMIKTILRITLGLLAPSLIKKYEKLPSLIFRSILWFKRQKRGVKVKHIDHEGYRFTYFSRGEPGAQPSILMLHGFSLNKDIWLNMIKLFPQDLHVVCLDMPGHGDTTRLLGESYTVAAQAKRVHQFVQCLELNKKPFHLVGMSTGGMIAGVYAAHYPSEVCCLSLLCPAGLKYPTESEFFARLREIVYSKDPADGTLLPVNEEQGENLLKLCLARPTTVNMQRLKGYLDDQRPHKMFFITCFLDISSAKSRFILHENMRRIRAPTQIIWGREDKVFDSTGAEMLATAIHNSQVHMLEKCGHFIALERPMKTAKLLLEFYSSVCERMGDKQPAQSSPRSQAAAE